MRLNPPTVLIDKTFLEALAQPEHEHHESAATAYLALVDDFEANTRLLAATATHLAAVPGDLRRTLFAPITTLHAAGQHRSAAKAMPEYADDPDLAVTLVLIHREKIGTVATFDPRYTQFDLDVLPDAQLVN